MQKKVATSLDLTDPYVPPDIKPMKIIVISITLNFVPNAKLNAYTLTAIIIDLLRISCESE